MCPKQIAEAFTPSRLKSSKLPDEFPALPWGHWGLPQEQLFVFALSKNQSFGALKWGDPHLIYYLGSAHHRLVISISPHASKKCLLWIPRGDSLFPQHL